MAAFRTALIGTAFVVLCVSPLNPDSPAARPDHNAGAASEAAALASKPQPWQSVWSDGPSRIIRPGLAWVTPAGAAAALTQWGSSDLPAKARGDWLARAQRGLADKEYEASRNAQGLQAPNRAHNLRTYFEPTGVRVVDRTAEGSPELLALRLTGWGRGDQVRSAEPGEMTSAGNHVEIRRTDLVEWYDNSAAGLEQGFTLAAAPEGEGPVVLELAVGGAQVSQEGDGLALTAASGRRLEYRGLAAYDAAGRRLPARLETGEEGVVRIAVEEAGACYPVTVDPLLAASGTLESNQAGAFLGSVAGAGDVNGDGYDDVIVGANSFDSGETNEGAAFVFLGSATGIANGSPTTAAATLQSNKVGAYLGNSVAGAGDVNGDGYDDVIVAASTYDAGEENEGAAFVFLGSATGVASGSPATAAAILQSNQANAFLGQVAGAGDVNGDGYADVIVGAPFYRAGEEGEGAAFVFSGSAAGIASGSPATAVTTLEASQANGLLGVRVAGAGDVNGDGYDDVIVGDWNSEAGGAAYVFLGSAAGVASGSPATAATTLQGNQYNAEFGSGVAGAGDVNGDGYADVIVGAMLYDAGETDEGAAFVFLGSAAGIANGSPTTAAATLQSNQADAFLGHVAGAGDVNGDGYDDVIVGAPLYDTGAGYGEGAAFVFLGSATGVASGSPATAVAFLHSGQSGAELGISVAGAGDVNGDGYADVIVGAPSYRAGEEGEGAAFVFLGGAAGVAVESPLPAVGLAIEGIRPNPALGRFTVSFVAPGTGQAKLEMFDVAGRRVLARDLKAPRAGRQSVDLGEGLHLSAGIYLVRVSQDGRAVSSRVALLR